MYSVNKLSKLSGVSARTLRYYDEIGLLPAGRGENGYRCYEASEVDRLQQILLYRELGFPLAQIQGLLDRDVPWEERMLAHRQDLLFRQKRLQDMIELVDRMIESRREGVKMQDSQKFECFKEQLVRQNEQNYGAEARRQYGDEQIEASNEKLLGMEKDEYDRAGELEREMFAALAQAMREIDPRCRAALRAAELHREWLKCFWPSYTKAAHAALVDTYVQDERFRAYYDAHGEGTAQRLRDAVHALLTEA